MSKRKEQSHQSRSPDREVGGSQGEQEPHIGKKEQEHGEERVDITVKESGLQGEEGGQAKSISL